MGNSKRLNGLNSVDEDRQREKSNLVIRENGRKSGVTRRLFAKLLETFLEFRQVER